MDGKDFLVTVQGSSTGGPQETERSQTNVCEAHGSFLDCAEVVVLQLFGFGKEYRPS